jgi:hypothetical protein
MPNYVVNRNAQPNGDHEVHRTDTCTRLPTPSNQDQLGWHMGCRSAVAAAKTRGYRTANGCYYCSGECHTT